MQFPVKLKIADIVFAITSYREAPVSWIRKNYAPFLAEDGADFVIILCYDREKRGLSVTGRSLGASASSGVKRGTPRNDEWPPFTDGLRLFPFFSLKSLETGMVQVQAHPDAGIVDILRLVCSAVIARKGGFFLHACAVIDNGGSYIFFGPSGSGKTTIARMSAGKIILTDETAAVIKRRGRYYAYSTPFSGAFGPADVNGGAPLRGFFSLKKDARFAHYPLSKARAMRELVCSVYMPCHTQEVLDSVSNTIESLLESVPLYELHFKKEPAVWRYIDECVMQNQTKQRYCLESYRG